MTAHTHSTLQKGCYRCELNVDEMKAARFQVVNEIEGVIRAIDSLKELLEEMREEEQGLRTAIMEFFA